MVQETGTGIFITFLLAVVGYAGLTTTHLISLKGKLPYSFWRITVIIILLHVAMIWSIRYEWNFALSVRNGWGGFVIFHSALILILGSLFIKESLAKILIRISFLIVTAGAVGAVFRYDAAAFYKLPVLICAAAGMAGFIISFCRLK